MTTTNLTSPADLDIKKLHSPAEIRAHRAEVDAYFAAVRSEADRLRKREEAARAEANRPLTEDEYFAQAQQQEAEKQPRIAEKAAEEKVAADAKEAYLASMPPTAEVDASNPYIFVLQLLHWGHKGYTLLEGADIAAFPNWYHATLVAPATAVKQVK